MHGTLPSSVEKDLPHFVMFFVAPIQFNFDVKTGDPIPLSKEVFRRNVWKTTLSMFMVASAFGIMTHYRFELFQKKEIRTLWDLFYWKNVLNNYAMACKYSGETPVTDMEK